MKSSTAFTEALTSSILDSVPSSDEECGPLPQYNAAPSPSSLPPRNSIGGPIAHWLFTGDELVDISTVQSSADLKELFGVREGTVAASVLNQCFHVCAPLVPREDDHDDEWTTILLPSAMQCWRIQAPLLKAPTEEQRDLALCAEWGADAGTCETLLRAVAAARVAHTTGGGGTSGPKKTVSLEHSLPLGMRPFDASPFEAIAEVLPWNATAVADAYERLGNHYTAQVLRGEKHHRQKDDKARSTHGFADLNNGESQLPRSTSVLRLGSELQPPIGVT